MQRHLFLTTATLSFALLTAAQNSSPFWSLAGNSNASATSKLGTTNANPLNLVTSNTTRLKIFPTGQSGFGANVTTANATRVLNLADANAVMRILRVHPSNAPAIELLSRTTSDGANVAYWDMYAEPSDKSFRIRDRVTGANLDRLTIKNNGYVGIGTTSPASQLHVAGSGRFTSLLSVDEGGIYSNNSSGNGIEGNGNNSYGMGTSGYGYYGVYGNGTYGVVGSGASYGVYGSGSSYGLYGVANSIGAYAYGGNYGVNAASDNGVGIIATSTNNLGASFYSANYYGLRAGTGLASQNWAGVFDGSIYTFGTYQPSDRTLKKNIKEFAGAMDIISRLKPKQYEYISEGRLAALHLPRGNQYGLLAQDLQEVLPDLVKEVENDLNYTGAAEKPVTLTAISSKEVPVQTKPAEEKKSKDILTIKAVNYTALIPIMVKGMQELSEKNKEIDELRAEVVALRQMVMEMKKGTSAATIYGSAVLEQNSPNPAKGNTTIRYQLPDNAVSARLTLINAKGQILKTIGLNNRGIGQTNLNTAALPAGVYTYTLWVDGQQAATRQLVISR